MSKITKWLQSVASGRRKRLSRMSRQNMMRRLRYERLEDRRVLAALTFTPAGQYGVGTGPEQVVAADFNGDGRADLAVVNRYSSNLSLLLNDGSGGYSPAGETGFSAGIYEILARDLDNDGDLDVVVAHESNSLSVLINQGGGTFAAAAVYGYPIGDASSHVVAADFTGDSAVDLAVVGFSTGNVLIFANNGSGAFVLHSQHATGHIGEILATGDFDGDGKVDVATAGLDPLTGGGKISVLFNQGNAAFEVTTFDSSPSYQVRGLLAADLNGDQRADLVSVNYGDSVTVHLNAGNRSFGPAVKVLEDQNIYWGAAEDLNGDGKIDLVAASLNGSVSILLNNGDGTFVTTAYATGGGIATFVLKDLDGDGDRDFAGTDVFDHRVVLLQNNGDGTFGEPVAYAVGDTPLGIAVADVDNDGKPDIVASSLFAGQIYVLRNVTDYVPSNPNPPDPPPPTPKSPLDSITEELAGLKATTTLTSGQVNSLLSKFKAAKASLSSGKGKTAINQINALGNQIAGLVKAKRLDSQTGKALIAELNALKGAIAQGEYVKQPAPKPGKKKK